MIKKCSSCGLSKPLEEFYVNNSSKDGKQSCCKNCSKNKNAVYKKLHRKPKQMLSPEEKKRRKKEGDKRWRQENPGKASARSRKYDYTKNKAAPVWLTGAHLLEIALFYQNRPKGCHVDHIVPINGKNVCGLHVPWNLQYLLAIDNIKKGNRF